MPEDKDLFIFKIKLEDCLILLVLALGVSSTFFSNKDRLGLALILLFAATAMYFIASTYARRQGGGKAVGFTRALNAFVSGLLFTVAPCIFFYHWRYNNIFESLVLIVFMLAGIIRIAAFDNFGARGDAQKFYFIGMPVFWSPVIVAAAYAAGHYFDRELVYAVLDVVLPVFSFLMLLNVEMKFLHKPIAWITKKTGK
jgi:phosphatidylserine synthase